MLGCFGGLECDNLAVGDPGNYGASITPSSFSTLAGQSRDLTIGFSNPNDIRGSLSYDIGFPSGFTPSASQIVIDWAGETHDSRTISVQVSSSVAAGTYTGNVSFNGSVLATVNIIVTEAAAPSFDITYDPHEVVVPPNGESPHVYFTVKSVNGFSGQVHFMCSTNTPLISVEGGPEEFDLPVTPTADGFFLRNFLREGSGGSFLGTFSGTAGSVTKTVTVTLN